MKKQILILTFFVLAIIAGTTKVQAQNLSSAPGSCITPTPISATCVVDDEFHPMAGKSYTYSVTVPTPATGTKNFTWLVTQDKTFIDNTGLVATPEASNGSGSHIALASGTYNNPPASGSVDITWKSFTHDAANPVFLVIYVDNVDGCTTDNIQVYVIEPVHTFTLDIANLNADGSAVSGDNSSCVSTVQSAVWDAVNNAVTMDYGENYLFFTVVAANYTSSWLPTFQVSGVTGTNTTVDVAWAYPSEAASGTWHTTTEAAGVYTPADAVAAQATTGTVGSTGECIVVRVHVDHNADEALVDIPVQLAVDGVMEDPVSGNYTTATLGDIHYEAGSGAGETCPWVDGYTNDVALHTITARPDVQDATGAASGATFLPKN